MNTQAVRDHLLALQANIIGAMEAEDGGRFLADGWVREPGDRLQGDGLSRLIEGGALFERAGCSFSHVKGAQMPPSATQHRPELAGAPFEAMGVSLVFHPRNPYVPTVHMNVRMFAALPPGREPVSWFGGGMDLTPYYGFEEDAAHFHRVNRDALAPFGADKYPRFKRWCDEYFFLKHRGEPRGIGGVFFDDFAEGGFDTAFAMLRAVGDAFVPAYRPIVQRRRGMAFGEREREFQAYRRGRYVEFNLVFDRGTLFGLQSGGRTESILMSMPPQVTWRYDWKPAPGTPEATLYSDFLRPRDWAEWTPRRLKLGLFGGTFDPPHLAHLALARTARDGLGLDEVRWLPAGQPWQKSRVITSTHHRVAMVALAIDGEDRFVLDDRETKRHGPSYTIDTVTEIAAEQPGAELVLILGADQHAGLRTWQRWRELLPRVTLAVAQRPGSAPPLDTLPHRRIDMPAMDVSATRIRELAARGEPIAALVPARVARYIARHRLYGN